MQENSKDYEFCIKLALDNAKKRISKLDNPDKKCVLEEYRNGLRMVLVIIQFYYLEKTQLSKII